MTYDLNSTFGKPKSGGYPPIGAAVKITFDNNDTFISPFKPEAEWRGFMASAGFESWGDDTSEFATKITLGDWNFLYSLFKKEKSYSKWSGIDDAALAKKINGTINGFINTILSFDAQIKISNPEAEPFFNDARLDKIDHELRDEKGGLIVDNFNIVFNQDEFHEWIRGKTFVFILQKNEYLDKNTGQMKTGSKFGEPMRPMVPNKGEWEPSTIFMKAISGEKLVVQEPSKGRFVTYEEYKKSTEGYDSNLHSVDDEIPY
jgi:hypothetical protein